MKLNLFSKSKAKNSVQKVIPDNFIEMGQFTSTDVFVAGFPKSGNTWMQNLVTGILLDSTSKLITPQLINEIVPDVQAKKYYKRFFKSMVFKTHLLPKPEYKKVIHLVRDGRDALVSYYNMGKNKNIDYKFSLKDMVVDGKGVYPAKWHTHAKAWIENPYNAEIIIVKYEDLHANSLREMKKISDYLEVDLSDERLMEIYNNNSIGNVRSRVEKFGMDNDHTWKNKPITSFFRKGKVGTYKDEMPSELISHFNNEAEKELAYFKYEK